MQQEMIVGARRARLYCMSHNRRREAKGIRGRDKRKKGVYSLFTLFHSLTTELTLASIGGCVSGKLYFYFSNPTSFHLYFSGGFSLPNLVKVAEVLQGKGKFFSGLRDLEREKKERERVKGKGKFENGFRKKCEKNLVKTLNRGKAWLGETCFFVSFIFR